MSTQKAEGPRGGGGRGGRLKSAAQPTPTELLACWALVGGIETISPGAFKGRLFDSKEAAEQWRSETINPGVWRVVEMRETTAPSDQDIESLALALQPRGYFANSQHKDDEIARVRSALSSFSLATTLSAREDAAWELVRTEVEQVTPSVIVRTGMPPHDPPTYKVTRYWQATIGKRTEELTDDPTAAPKAPTAGEGK